MPAQQQERQNPFQPDIQSLVFETFNGINTSTTRPGVTDEQMWWCDGYFPIGPRDLRTLPDLGAAIWTPASGTIDFFDFGNIGATPYLIGFTSLGNVVAVNTDTLVATEIAPNGTIANPSRTNVAMTQFGSQYIIIVSAQANGYFIWDGTTFFNPGDSWPYPSGNIPTGISGTAVEIYQGRVWIADGAVITFSAPGSVVDFTSGDGGGTFTSSDSFLRVQFTELIQTNGFLYLIGDSSINYISGVQTSGTIPTTTFTNQNADPEVGTIWPGTIDVFGRNIIFANAFGAHVSYGAAVTKVSEPLDGVYNTAVNFGGRIPSAAKAIIYGKKVWILLLDIIDPITGQDGNKLFLWDGKKWFSSPQSKNLLFIQHQEINSVLTAYGTDGASVYPLFNTPSTLFQKTVQSKFWDKPLGYQNIKAASRLFGMVQYYSLASPDVSVSVNNENTGSTQNLTIAPAVAVWTNQFDVIVDWTNSSPVTVQWFVASVSIVVLSPTAIGQAGVLLGLTITTSAADMSLISFMVQVDPVQYRG